MDQSVICIEDPVEIIDLSETLNESAPNSGRNEGPIVSKNKENRNFRNKQTPIIEVDGCSTKGSPRKSLESCRSCNMCCPICFEKFLNVAVKATICGHVFCSECIESIIRVERKCPKCRRNLRLRDLKPLYF